jgi:hypothetical protein
LKLDDRRCIVEGVLDVLIGQIFFAGQSIAEIIFLEIPRCHFFELASNGGFHEPVDIG